MGRRRQGGPVVDALAYTPTNWVNGVTPTNAVNLNKLEAGVAAALVAPASPADKDLLFYLAGTGWISRKIALTDVPAGVELTANKAVANGYPSLDAGGLVPVSQLPSSLAGAVTRFADVSVAADAATVDLTGIPATATHLLAIVYGRSTGAVNADMLGVRLNGDSGAGQYYYSNASGNIALSTYWPFPGANHGTTTEFGCCVLLISNYAQAVNGKPITTWITPWDSGSTIMNPANGLTTGAFWKGTAIVNRATFSVTNGNIKAGSRVSLYGLS